MASEIRLNKKFFSILVVVLFILVVIAAWLSAGVGEQKIESEYSAVYLATGEIYFGKLHRFPKFYLSDAWLLQRGVSSETNPTGINILPFNQAFWGPTDKIYLNRDQVIFIAKLRNDSPVKDFIAGSSPATNPALIPDSINNPVVTP